MKIIVNEGSLIQIEEVFNPIVLKTLDGDMISIQMRGRGFEFEYKGELYYVKDGVVSSYRRSERGNILVDQNVKNDSDLPTASLINKQTHNKLL